MLKILDLFCGAGGASMGYWKAGWKVVGVDVVGQPLYPFEFHQADALEFSLDGFDAIHASPPCQAYVPLYKNRENKWPKLIPEIREKLIASGLPFIIENVPGAPINGPILCGTMFKLSLIRHRLFETNWGLKTWPLKCDHAGTVAAGNYAGVYGFGAHGKRLGGGRLPKAVTQVAWANAMGIDWMDDDGLREAIPPAYTEFIGRQLKRMLKSDSTVCERCGVQIERRRITRRFCSDKCRVYAHMGR
jgi:DNA (cytosine-5)-methyltransferase 1